MGLISKICALMRVTERIVVGLILILGLALVLEKPQKALAAPADHFVTTWKTDNAGFSNSTSIIIPTNGVGYNYDVDWDNDGTFDEFGITGNATHDYGVAGTYTVRIQGDFPSIFFSNSATSDKEKILSVDQWGTIQWESMWAAFHGCENLDIVATDTPDLSNVTTMSNMFSGVLQLEGTSAFASWDTSTVQDMSGLFIGAALFNQPIGSWDVSNVTNFTQMFQSAVSFNQPLGSWNTSSATTMQSLFLNAHMFNQPIDNWDVSNVTDFMNMFNNAQSFDQPLNSWNTSSATTMNSMFATTLFNQPIDNWDVSNVTDMSYMFYVTSAFNQPLNSWDTSSVTTFEYMFARNTVFNQPLSNWNTSQVTNMLSMFRQSLSFDQDLSSWDFGAITTMQYMFAEDAGLSTNNYDALLVSLSGQTLQNSVTFDAGNSLYCAVTERDDVITTYSWTINDLGEDICGRVADLEVVTSDGYTNVEYSLQNYEMVQTITNNGPMSVDDIQFTLNSNDCLSISTITTSGTATNTGSYSSEAWTGELASGETLILTFSASFTCLANGVIDFDHEVTDLSIGGETMFDTVSDNNSYTDQTTIVMTLSLDVTTDDGYTEVFQDESSPQITQTISNDAGGTVDYISFQYQEIACISINSVTTSGTATDTGTYTIGANEWSGILEPNESLILTFNTTFTCGPATQAILNHTISVAEYDGNAYGSITYDGSDFYDATNLIAKVTDLSISKVLQNPEDFAQGETLVYEITITNTGNYPLDLTDYDGSGVNPFATALFFDVAPSDLTFVSGSSTNPTIACNLLGPATMAGPWLATHDDHTITGCVYIGADSLDNGESISTAISFDVANDSSLDFYNKAITGFADFDPDYSTMIAPYGGGGACDVNSDIIDCYVGEEINNIALSDPVADFQLGVDLQTEGNVAQNQSIEYVVRLTNGGVMSTNLAVFNSLQKYVFSVLFPGSLISFVGTDNTDLSCVDLGPNSIAYLGYAGADHDDYNMLSCVFNNNSMLAVNDSIDLGLEFVALQNLDSDFDIYAIGPQLSTDLDILLAFQLIGLANEDILDQLALENENVGAAQYQFVAGVQTDSPSIHLPFNLAATGDRVPRLLLFAVLFISLVGIILYRIRKM